MNPALLQQAYHVDYPLNSDSKYLGQERSFSNPTTLAATNFPQINRKDHNGLNSTPLGQTLSLPTNAGLEYNSHQLIPENSYHSTSQLLLSPPSSVDGSASGGLQPTSSSLNFSGALKLATSNASSADHFASTTAPFLSSSWNDSTMTDYTSRYRSVPVHPTLSPPLSYNHSHGLSSQYLSSTSRSMEQYPNSYPFTRSLNTSDMSRSLFARPAGSPTFSSLPAPYPVNNPYASMPPQSSMRPDGPPFEETERTHTLITGRNLTLLPEISASISKGFFQVEGKWTCYRRNYFAVSCGFSFKNGAPDGPAYLQRHSQLEPVQQYAVSISARTANVSNQESESRQLVQHTPKRDKATESVPGRHVIQPAPTQALHTNGGLPIGLSYAASQQVPPDYQQFGAPSHPLAAPTLYTFERIQFQKATANNGKRRAQQQYFHVVVELSVNIGRPGGEDSWVVVATRQSHPMVVRGRSPGHYKDNMRRDDQHNLGPDQGSGPGADGGSSGLPMPPLLGAQSSSMDWNSSSHRHNHHYGHSYQRRAHGSDCSPGSVSSSTTLTGSPTDSEFQLTEFSTSRGSITYDLERSILNPAMDRGHAGVSAANHGAFSRKRAFEDEESSCDQNYYSGPASTDEVLSPHAFEFGNIASVKTLCAST